MKLDIAKLSAEGTKHGSVVFLHGAWSWNWYWKPFFMPYFAAKGYDCAALSLRGHGESEGLADIHSFSIGDYVRDLREAVSQLDNPLIVGHSMGGLITQAYLTHYPARGAVLLAAAPPKPDYGSLLKMLRTQPAAMLRAMLQRKMPYSLDDKETLRRQMFSREPDDTSMDQYLKNIQPESARAVSSMLTRGVKDYPKVKSPLLILGAGRDNLIPPASVAITGRAYNLTPIMFDEMSHMMMLETRWQDVADAIIRFDTSL